MKKTTLIAGVIAASVIAPYPILAAPSDRSAELSTTQPLSKSESMWFRGDFLPVEYYDEIIDQSGVYALSEAPNGYQWIRIDDAAYLTNVASGYIADIAVDLRYQEELS
jgi:Ni/Co efflux regulator RcnB